MAVVQFSTLHRGTTQPPPLIGAESPSTNLIVKEKRERVINSANINIKTFLISNVT